MARLCQERGIRRLALFGSAARGEATDASDLDVLVEFEEGHKPGLGFFGLQRELTQLFGREVDLNTPEFLSPEFRQAVIDGAVNLYAVAERDALAPHAPDLPSLIEQLESQSAANRRDGRRRR